ALPLLAVGGWLGPAAACVLPAAVPVAVVSFLDDRSGVGVRWRFAVHLAAALGLIVLVGLPAGLSLPGAVWQPARPLLTVLTVLFCVWMLNLYNFMDGMDGFAGGMTVCGYATLALLGMAAGDAAYAVLAALPAVAALGFLAFNFPPARIFMGDTGAATLGFLAAGLILYAERSGLFPFWTGLLAFAPFIVDATVTLLRRLLRGERIWEAHRSHYYQRLVRLGWGHRRTVLAEYALMLVCAAAALAGPRLPAAGQALLLAATALLFVTLAAGVARLERSAAP
ncbi:MAG TPA: glycosyl transferase, partial [Plasticicumulans sp.]|nr:glycosyl transferase [Plasticicumulans sp.]